MLNQGLLCQAKPVKGGLVMFFETFRRKSVGIQPTQQSLTSSCNRVLRNQ